MVPSTASLPKYLLNVPSESRHMFQNFKIKRSNVVMKRVSAPGTCGNVRISESKELGMVNTFHRSKAIAVVPKILFEKTKELRLPYVAVKKEPHDAICISDGDDDDDKKVKGCNQKEKELTADFNVAVTITNSSFSPSSSPPPPPILPPVSSIPVSGPSSPSKTIVMAKISDFTSAYVAIVVTMASLKDEEDENERRKTFKERCKRVRNEKRKRDRGGERGGERNGINEGDGSPLLISSSKRRKKADVARCCYCDRDLPVIPPVSTKEGSASLKEMKKTVTYRLHEKKRRRGCVNERTGESLDGKICKAKRPKGCNGTAYICGWCCNGKERTCPTCLLQQSR